MSQNNEDWHNIDERSHYGYIKETLHGVKKV